MALPALCQLPWYYLGMSQMVWDTLVPPRQSPPPPSLKPPGAESIYRGLLIPGSLGICS